MEQEENPGAAKGFLDFAPQGDVAFMNQYLLIYFLLCFVSCTLVV